MWPCTGSLKTLPLRSLALSVFTSTELSCMKCVRCDNGTGISRSSPHGRTLMAPQARWSHALGWRGGDESGGRNSASKTRLSHALREDACVLCADMPERPASEAAQRRQPDVLDNHGEPVLPVSDAQQRPSLALDAHNVQGKVCYGVMLFSNTHALSGRDPVRRGRDPLRETRQAVRATKARDTHLLPRTQTCLGVTVRKAVPAPTPSSARSNAVPADAPFRFSCTGRSTHVVQPPAKAGGKVLLPYCEGLEVRAAAPHRCVAHATHARAALLTLCCLLPLVQILAASQASDVVPRRDGVHPGHGDAHAGGPQRPPLGGLGPQASPPVILDVTAFYERWKKSANKIAQRMQDNVNATLSLLTGGSGRRGG